MPRSTMPIRGLRDTEPYHWDGIPGDPYGGINSANIRTRVESNSDVKDPVTSARLPESSKFTSLFLVFSFTNFIDNQDNLFFSKKVNLGLDLQGGSYLLLEIDIKPGPIASDLMSNEHSCCSKQVRQLP